MMVTIPKQVRVTKEWAHVHHVEILYEPPRLILVPLALEELMNRPRTEGEEGAPK